MRHMVIAIVLVLTGCFGKPLERFKDKAKDGATATDGVAAISGANGGSVTGAGAVAGASAEFAPGTLAVDTNVTIEEGLPLDTDATAAELGVAEGFGTAGAAVAVSSSTPTDGVSPFTISLPMPAPAAALQGDPYELVVILFKYFIAAENRYEIGVWAKDKFTIDGTTAKVPTLYFGVYQAVFAKSLIATSIKIASATPIVTKAQDAAAAPVTWSAVEIVSSVGLKAKMRATVTGLPGLAACVMVADRDKAEPWDVVSPKLTVSEYEFTAPEAGTYAARFECTGTDGRLSPVSDWSGSIALTGVLPPEITSVDPLIIPSDGGSVLTVTGKNFKAGATLKIDDDACTPVTVDVKKGQIKCTLPALASGKYAVSVTQGSDTATKKDAITSKDRGLLVLNTGDPDYGDKTIGAGLSKSFSLKNNGEKSVTGIAVAISGDADFTLTANACAGATVAPQGACVVTMLFAPGASGARSADFSVSYNDGFGSQSHSLFTLDGVGLTPASLSLDLGSSYSFGTLANGYFRIKNVVVTNDGETTATGMSTSGVSAPFTLLGGGGCTATLAAGASCSYNIKYTAEAALNGASSPKTLTIAYNDGVGASTTTLGLTGSSSTIIEATSLAIGQFHTCARTTADIVKCWGKNTNGQLGLGNVTDIGRTGTSPVSGSTTMVPLPAPTVSVFGNGDASHTCAVSDTKQLYCWGPNTHGQLGQGNVNTIGDGAGEVAALVPIDLGAGYWVKDVAVGGTFVCAKLGHDTPALDNGVKCWGDNSVGQLGQGDTTNRGGAANQMGDNLPPINFGANDAVTAIAAGASHACAIMQDSSRVRCWGLNDKGQLGLDSMTDEPSPGALIDLGVGLTATSVSAGYEHTCAMLSDGSVKCWGGDTYGQLGDAGSNVNIGDGVGEMALLGPLAFGGLTPVNVIASRLSTCSLMTNGNIMCWGSNDQGLFGLDPIITSSFGDSSAAYGPDLYITTQFFSSTPPVFGFGGHMCIKLSDTAKSLRCMGSNYYGQTGLGNVFPFDEVNSFNAPMNDTATLVDLD